jgi:hypothetical protein
MVVTTRGYMVTIICDEPTSEHLIPNLSSFKAECCGIIKMKGYVQNTGRDEDIIKMEFYGDLSIMKDIINYVKQHYVNKYPLYMTMVEIRKPM